MIRSLFKISGKFFIGSAFSQAFIISVWIIIARFFDPETIGQLFLYLTFLWGASFFADFGLNQWYQKNIHEIQEDDLYNKVFNARIISFFVSGTILLLVLYFLKPFSLSIALLLILTLIPDGLMSISEGYYFAQKKGTKIAIRSTSISLSFLVFFFFFRTLGFSVIYQLYVAYMLAKTITAVWFLPWHIIKKTTIRPLNESIKTLRSSLKYALLLFSSYAYSKGDSILIGFQAGNTALGFYSLSYRYLEGLSLFASGLAQNFFHISAKPKHVSEDQIKKIALIMGLFGGFLAISVFFLSEFLIITVLGSQYSNAVPIMKVFSFVLFLFYLNAPISTVVQSSDQLKKFLPFGIANTIINLVLNFLCIPIFGVIASAWIMVLTESIGFLINVYFVRRVYEK